MLFYSADGIRLSEFFRGEIRIAVKPLFISAVTAAASPDVWIVPSVIMAPPLLFLAAIG